MMTEIELALALSARRWADDLHRFLADHGGARVRVTAMKPDDLGDETFDVLLIDDICSFLSAHLVEAVRRTGRAVVGVYDPEEFADGKDRLLECGVSDVVEATADPDEFLGVISRVASVTSLARPSSAPVEETRGGGRISVVIGSSGGVGVTEASLQIARRLTDTQGPTVLVDADSLRPGIAPRLGLPLHPNLRAAEDGLEHGTRPVESFLHDLGGLHVLAGAAATETAEVAARRLAAVVDALRSQFRHVVADLGGSPSPAALRRIVSRPADRVIVVVPAVPLGAVRLLDMLPEIHAVVERPVDILVNRSGRDRYRRGEIIEEILRTYRPASLAFLPDDPTVPDAAWEGRLVGTGRFRRALDRWVDRFEGAV